MLSVDEHDGDGFNDDYPRRSRKQVDSNTTAKSTTTEESEGLTHVLLGSTKEMTPAYFYNAVEPSFQSEHTTLHD